MSAPSFFYYVFDTETRDRMIETGYLLLRNDEANSVFVFAANPELTFDFGDARYMRSDELAF